MKSLYKLFQLSVFLFVLFTSVIIAQDEEIFGFGTSYYVPKFTSATTIGNSNIYVNSSSNVGIGTTSPVAKLDINGTLRTNNTISLVSGSTTYLSFSSTNSYLNGGKLGIGTTSPLTDLHVQNSNGGSVTLANTSSTVGLLIGSIIGRGNGYSYNAAKINMNIEDAWSGGNYSSRISFWTTGNNSTILERMRIDKNGNVLINKTSQTNTAYKLDVNGKIRANEIVVNTSGADFVFENNYKLRALDEVESFIKENGHLPEIQSAEEMQESGLSLSEMNTKLLQKVEELTLYLIEQNKQIKNLTANNEELRKMLIMEQ